MTRTEIFYYFILFVYISLWACQLVACHLTHSLIILTESYINLYRILDISLGILHLRTQIALAEPSDDLTNDKQHKHKSMAGKLFNSVCTYQFKRLPLLGSFVNGLFLAALLMSAAIEGIQTCFHSGHSQGYDQKTILEQSALTYPIVLVGFALVGLIMQYCSMRAHEMREEELCSDSLMDLARLNGQITCEIDHKLHEAEINAGSQTVIELNANNLATSVKLDGKVKRGKRQSYHLNNSNNSASQCGPQLELPLTIRTSEIARDSHDENAANNDSASNKISLKSLRFSLNLESINSPSPNVNSISQNLNKIRAKSTPSSLAAIHRDNWFLVRYLTSPLALIACAAIVYFANDELAKEISDAALAVTVVLLLFASSYPPMKQAGRILLQTAPDGVQLECIRRDLESSSALILEVRNLHVWSLTPRSNRVATCTLVLDKNQIENELQVKEIIAEARYRFLDQNIKCTTIEPVFEDLQQHKQVD